MQPLVAPLVTLLPTYAYDGVLVLARVGTAVMLVPLLGEAEIPSTVRAGFALLLTALLLPTLLDLLPPTPSTPLRAAAQVLAEILTGLWFGWLTRLLIVALSMAGQVVSLATGLSSVLQQDPALGTQSAALTRLMTVAAPVVLLASGLHAWPLAALAGSYRVVQAGAFLPAADTAREVLGALGAAFALAIRLATPFLAASVVWQLAVALAGRLAAQLQPMNLSAPIQVLGGLLLLTAVPAGLLAVWREHAADVLGTLPGLR